MRELLRGQTFDADKIAPDFHMRKFRPHHSARRDARVEIVAAERLADERTAPIPQDEANLIVAHGNLPIRAHAPTSGAERSYTNCACRCVQNAMCNSDFTSFTNAHDELASRCTVYEKNE